MIKYDNNRLYLGESVYLILEGSYEWSIFCITEDCGEDRLLVNNDLYKSLHLLLKSVPNLSNFNTEELNNVINLLLAHITYCIKSYDSNLITELYTDIPKSLLEIYQYIKHILKDDYSLDYLDFQDNLITLKLPQATATTHNKPGTKIIAHKNSRVFISDRGKICNKQETLHMNIHDIGKFYFNMFYLDMEKIESIQCWYVVDIKHYLEESNNLLTVNYYTECLIALVLKTALLYSDDLEFKQYSMTDRDIIFENALRYLKGE